MIKKHSVSVTHITVRAFSSGAFTQNNEKVNNSKTIYEFDKLNNTPTNSYHRNLKTSEKKQEHNNRINNLNKILQSPLVSPSYDNGSFIGYKIVGILPNSVPRKPVLQESNITTRVNGNKLTSPEFSYKMSQIDDISATPKLIL